MTRLWLIRHGPTHARVILGRTDLPADLSDLVSLDALRAALPAAPIVSSDLKRAVATADALQGARPRLPHEPALREFDFGEWDGRAHNAIDGPELRSFFDDPGAQRAPGGESWNDVSARVAAALDRLAGGLSGQFAGPPDLIVVAHMGTILTMWARATGLRPLDALAQTVPPLSLTRIDMEPGGMVARTAGRMPADPALQGRAAGCQIKNASD